MANEDSTLNLPESYKTSPVLELILERVTSTSEEVTHLREEVTHLREEQKQLREDMNSKIDTLREDMNSKIDALRGDMKTGFRVLTRRMEVVSIDMIELRGQQREVIEVVEKSIGQPT